MQVTVKNVKVVKNVLIVRMVFIYKKITIKIDKVYVFLVIPPVKHVIELILQFVYHVQIIISLIIKNVSHVMITAELAKVVYNLKYAHLA